jgi:hypothetical protein
MKSAKFPNYTPLRFFAVRTLATSIATNSLDSDLTAVIADNGIVLDSANKSSQYRVSSISCNEPSILLTKSAIDFARIASQYWAPTDVPDLNNCRPRTWATVDLGS